MNEVYGTREFLPKHGNYRDLIVFQKAECIYDITYYFTHTYFEKGDRTIDQMVQAARSGRQNIAEGSKASVTSSETEIKLINVAKASLHELLLDYEDYLRVRNLSLWDYENEKTQQLRRVCSRNNDSSFYMERVPSRSAEVICNLAITLIHQADLLLHKLLQRLQHDFVEQGGIKERMLKAWLDFRRNNDKNL